MFGYTDADISKLHMSSLRLQEYRNSDISLFKSLFTGIMHFTELKDLLKKMMVLFYGMT